MNTKRQTIWLVSMLSLMVVLSAYYLFTEDVGNQDLATGANAPKEIIIDAGEVAAPRGEVKPSPTASVQPTPTAMPTATAAPTAKPTASPGVKPDTKAPTDKSTTAAPTSGKLTDAQVLDKVQAEAQAMSGDAFFANGQLKRSEEISKKNSELLAIITDSKQTQDAVAKAHEQLNQLMDMDDKVTNLESRFMKDFKNVLITQEASKWKVTVQTEKLDKSQTVAIIDSVMKELNVGPEKVVVRYTP